MQNVVMPSVVAPLLKGYRTELKLLPKTFLNMLSAHSMLLMGTLTEWEGLVQLTSSLG